MFRDSSEDENVGIMQGFMDSLEEMLGGEEDMSEEDDSPSGAPDRTPSSPEILMNTLRGDMRSVDARIDELADMVGYNAASSTPLEVLALLQPVLKQQGIAALPADSAMPPPPTGAPPSGAPVPPVPAQGGGIATLPQGDMGQGPPPVAMAEGGEVNPYSGYANPMSGGMTNPMNFQSQKLAGGGIAPYTGPMMTTGNYTGPMPPPQTFPPVGMGPGMTNFGSFAGTGGGVTGITGNASGGMDRMPADYGMPPPMFPSNAYSGPPQSNPLGNVPSTGYEQANQPMTSPMSGVTGITGTVSGGMDRMPADYGMPPPQTFPPVGMGPGMNNFGPPAGTGGGMTSPMVSYPSPQPFQGGGVRPQNPMMAPKPSQFPMGGGPQQPQRKGPQQSQMRGPQQSSMSGGIGSLAQGNMGASPRLMAKGGPVQYFQDGSTGAGVTSYDAQLNEFLSRVAQDPTDPMARAKELAPQYQELLGTSDSGATKAQILFDIAQAALGYASNVGPDGQPLRGSQASRLAGATRALPGQIAARGAQSKEGEARARLAALQQAQSEQAVAQASNAALSSDQRAILLAREKQAGDMALEMAKGRPTFRPATPEEASQNNAVSGQVDDKTGRFYPSTTPSGMSITSTPDGGLQFTQGPGIGGSGSNVRNGLLYVKNDEGVDEAVVIPGTPAAVDAQAQLVILQTAIAMGENILGTVESIVGRPAVEGGAAGIAPNKDLASILGMFQGRVAPLTQAGEDLRTKIDQIGGRAFLEAFETLKGGGAISQEEGLKATQAIARISRTQSPEAFVASFNEFADIVRRGIVKANADLAALPRLATPPARTVISFDQQGNPTQ